MMSRWAAVMGRCPPVQRGLLLIVFLLKSSNIVWSQGESITGADHHLQCVNDYLFTINCTLNISPPDNASVSNSSYWLTLTNTFEETKFVCRLKQTPEAYFCSIKTSSVMPHDDDYPDIFSDGDGFEISLCNGKDDGSEACELLDDEYTPVTHIKPNAPCCLTVSHNSSQYHFIWKSTYEEYSDFTSLTENLQYQLHFYKTGDKTGEVTHVNIDTTSYSLDDEKCLPDTEYAARVRASPNMAHYKGQWSGWSSEVLWRTYADKKGLPKTLFVFELRMVFIAFCVVVTLLVLCYVPVKKWRQSTFIPNPAPYFHTLYSDCQGDFKSWVVTHDNKADVMKVEDTLQIDTLINCTDIQEDGSAATSQQQLLDGGTYRNIPSLVSDSDPRGFPYTDSTVGSLGAPGSSLDTAGDSGCWLCSETFLEKEHSWYSNEYCTLSCFQQSGSVPVEHNDSLEVKSCQKMACMYATRKA